MMMTSLLSSELIQILEMRDLWRRLHQQGDQAGVHRLLEDTRLRELLQEPLSPTLPPEFAQKLVAFGREWERAIVMQALREEVDFAETLLHLDPSQVVRFQAVVEERLKQPRPWGAFLFVESAIPLELTKESWKAVGYFVLGRGNRIEQLNLATCPGVNRLGERSEVMP